MARGKILEVLSLNKMPDLFIEEVPLTITTQDLRVLLVEFPGMGCVDLSQTHH